MYENIANMYEINNLNDIITLKDQLKKIKINKGEIGQSYNMRISRLRDQLQRVGENVPKRDFFVTTLRGIPPILETFIMTISNNNFLPSLDDIVGKLTQEESRMIVRGRIQKHEEGEPSAYIAHDKRKREKGGPSTNPPSQHSK